MNIFKMLCDIAQKRVNKYGAQYYTFGIFGVINYPLSTLYELRIGNITEGVWLRLIATFLCLLMLFKNKWPEKLKKYLPLYWYITVTISLPVIASYMLLKDGFSLGWLINFNIGVMISVLILDSLSFFITEILGIFIGCGIYFIFGNAMPSLPDQYYTELFLYMLGCIIMLVGVFSRNKEIFNEIVQKSKDNLNTQLELKVVERTQKLEEALSAKNEFVNNISHEIRTPIQGFTSLSEGLVDHWSVFTDLEKFEMATKVAKNAQRLADVVGNILDLSKFISNKMILHFELFDFDLLMKNMIEECNSLYSLEKKFHIIYQKFTDESLVKADSNRLEQVIRNILYNAIKYSSEDGYIYCVVEDYHSINYKDYLHLRVEDRGIGIPEEELIQIFEPFIQSSRSKNRAGGTGLGLSISREIIKAHNGIIWAENNQGIEGSTFSIALPKYKEEDNTILNEENESNNLFEDINYTKLSDNISYSILMIDDEEICLDSMEMILLGNDYLFIKSQNSYSGIEYLKKSRVKPDLILLDLMLPDIYGLDVLDIIKSDSRLSSIPVILQTGVEDPHRINLAYEKGIIGYFKKPYKKDLIVKEIAKILKQTSK